MAGSAVLILVVLLLVVGIGAAFLLLGSASEKEVNKYPLEGTWFNPGLERSKASGVKGMAIPHYIKFSRINSNGSIVYKANIPDIANWNAGVPMIITVDPNDSERLTFSNIDGSDTTKWTARYIPDTDTIDYNTASGGPEDVWMRKKAYMEKYNI